MMVWIAPTVNPFPIASLKVVVIDAPRSYFVYNSGWVYLVRCRGLFPRIILGIAMLFRNLL